MGAHVFVDETQQRGYLLVAAAVESAGLHTARRVLHDLVLPGQRRLHMQKESDPRRRQILSALVGLVDVQVLIYDATRHRSAKTARPACLTRLVADLAKSGASRLVESVVLADQRVLYRQVHAEGIAEALRYDHLRAHQEILLALPDAVAWSWAKGGRWRAAVRQLVAEVREV